MKTNIIKEIRALTDAIKEFAPNIKTPDKFLSLTEHQKAEALASMAMLMSTKHLADYAAGMVALIKVLTPDLIDKAIEIIHEKDNTKDTSSPQSVTRRTAAEGSSISNN